MKIVITESKMQSALLKLLKITFPGFEDIYYDWANYNCGMGECCDPYAIGFVLSQNNYDDYLFKLVESKYYDDDGDYSRNLSDDLPELCYESPDVRDPRFDVIIFYEVFAEELEQYLGPKSLWENELLNLLNRMFFMDAKTILFI
jgi:hypothetical protein